MGPFKAKILERFRDRDFEKKVITKLNDLSWQGSQQEYTTKFLHLLSQLDEELPESVKRWLNQRHCALKLAGSSRRMSPTLLTLPLTSRDDPKSRVRHRQHAKLTSNRTANYSSPQGTRSLDHRREVTRNLPVSTVTSMVIRSTFGARASGMPSLERPASATRKKTARRGRSVPY